MAGTEKSTAKVDEVRPYVEGVAKNLVDKLYGPAGLPWGTTLTELEDVCLGIRAALTEKMLDVALERQAADHPQRPRDFGCCPECQRLPRLRRHGTPLGADASGRGRMA